MIKDIYDVIGLVPWSSFGHWLTEQAVVLTATAIAAFVGVDRAFAHERKKREEDLGATHAAAIRRALFALTRAHGFIAGLDKDFCRPLRADPRLKVVIKPFISTSIERWLLDIESLSFLLETEHRQLMLLAHIREEGFQMLARLMQRRSETVASVIQPAIARLFPPANGTSNVDMTVLQEEVGVLKVFEVSELSNDIIELVEEEMREIPKLQAALRVAAGKLFPTQDFKYLALAPRSSVGSPPGVSPGV